jgi:hypothetical protein
MKGEMGNQPLWLGIGWIESRSKEIFIMSIITSNQSKRQIIVDPIFILFFSVLVVLLVFAVSTANKYYFTANIGQTYESAPAGLSLNSEVSFTADKQYWSEYCDSGWSSDATCDAIFARTQSCTTSVDSAYCSNYEKYLQEFNR